MRKTALDMVYELARSDNRIFFIGSDLGIGTLKQFKAEMPERFFMEGVSEANIIGIAAGLALEGKIVYINTIATFLTRRCFEQVALDLCLHNARVRLIASGGGLVYAPLGPTHEAIDDIAIFRALPRMTIIAPADADEMRRLMPLTVDYPGPIYIRLGKGGDPIVTNDRVPFEMGKAIPMKEGGDALIVSTGVMLKAALDAAGSLEGQGIDAVQQDDAAGLTAREHVRRIHEHQHVLVIRKLVERLGRRVLRARRIVEAVREAEIGAALPVRYREAAKVRVVDDMQPPAVIGRCVIARDAHGGAAGCENGEDEKRQQQRRDVAIA